MRRPFLTIGIILITVALSGLFLTFIYPRGNDIQGNIQIVSFAIVFFFCGLWACFKKEKVKPAEYLILFPPSRGFVGKSYQRPFAESTHEVFKAFDDEEAKEILKKKCKEKEYSVEHSRLFKQVA